MSQKTGMFIISLDFELFWGMHDIIPLKQYKKNLLGTHQAVSDILNLFKEYNIHATWAVVGMLYFRNMSKLYKACPVNTPSYKNPGYSAYHYMTNNPIREETEQMFFAPDLIQEISQTKHQEIATHTFSHVYTNEDGINQAALKADLEAALETAKKNGHQITSIIFPRNQLNNQFLSTCQKLGIQTYRGTEKTFIYRDGSNDQKKYHIRALRLLDQYFNLFGHQTYPTPTEADPLYNLPASSFLMPFSKKRKWLEPLKFRRIKRAMTYAAKNNEIFHLWWHPHNFGMNIMENIHLLRQILQHFQHLQQQYQFQSFTMREVTNNHLNTYSKEEYSGNSMEKIHV